MGHQDDGTVAYRENDAVILEQMPGSVFVHEGEICSSLSYCLDALEEKKTRCS